MMKVVKDLYARMAAGLKMQKTPRLSEDISKSFVREDVTLNSNVFQTEGVGSIYNCLCLSRRLSPWGNMCPLKL